jgi:hypothetical protein
MGAVSVSLWLTGGLETKLNRYGNVIHDEKRHNDDLRHNDGHTSRTLRLFKCRGREDGKAKEMPKVTPLAYTGPNTGARRLKT